jgi:hypothetical protein
MELYGEGELEAHCVDAAATEEQSLLVVQEKA